MGERWEREDIVSDMKNTKDEEEKRSPVSKAPQESSKAQVS